MKQVIFMLCVLLFASNSLQAQRFRGEVRYKIYYIAKKTDIDTALLRQQMNRSFSTYLINSKAYKASYFNDGAMTYSYTYEPESAYMYDEVADEPFITYRDSRKATSAGFQPIEINRDSTQQILGYPCYLTTNQSEDHRSFSWFSDRLRIKYKGYAGHNEGNWYAQLEQTGGAIPLKSVTEFEDYYQVMEAVSVKKRKIKKGEFSLPTDKPIVASPFALDTRVEMLPPEESAIECYRAAVELAPDVSGRTTPFTSYVQFVLTENGSMEFIKALEEDEHGLHKLSENIIRNCGFRFKAGMINGKAVPSLVYFPVEFLL